MNTSVLPEAATAALEGALNAVIALDPESRRRLAGLAGRIIAIEVRGIGTPLFVAPTTDGIQLLARFDGEPDARLSGTPFGLLRLGAGETAGLFAGEVAIEGDTQLGQRFKRILDDLDIDWEAQLAQLTGDVLAHQVGNTVRTFSAWLGRSADTLARDTGDYLREEQRLLPSGPEVSHFLDEVDRLRADVDRLTARLDLLQQ